MPDIQQGKLIKILHRERRIMTYYQFVQEVEKKVKREAGKNIAVCIHTAVKNNGRKRKGLMITKEGVNISPAIYLEEYYEQFEEGVSLEDIVRDILRLYNGVKFCRSWDGKAIADYAAINGKIIYQLINWKKNKERLSEVPYRPYLDMAVVFYVLMEVSEYGTAVMLIKKEHLDVWKVTEEEIYARACSNTEHLLPCEFQTMKAVIAELTDRYEDKSRDVMYVLSNHIRSHGAAAILYEGRLKEIGEYLKESYYVLPSSVHEVIIIPESEAPGRKALIQMVTEINATQVETEEVLSDNAYYYDRETGKLLE